MLGSTPLMCIFSNFLVLTYKRIKRQEKKNEIGTRLFRLERASQGLKVVN